MNATQRDDVNDNQVTTERAGQHTTIVESKPGKRVRSVRPPCQCGDGHAVNQGSAVNESARLRSALASVLDAVDYTSGACGLTDMVGAVLPPVLIEKARKALEPRR